MKLPKLRSKDPCVASTCTSRVRPYVPPIPVTEPPPAYEVAPQAALVRPYVLDSDHCARRRAERRATAPARVSRTRRGVVVRLDHPATGHARAEAPPAPPEPPSEGLVLAGVTE